MKRVQHSESILTDSLHHSPCEQFKNHANTYMTLEDALENPYLQFLLIGYYKPFFSSKISSKALTLEYISCQISLNLSNVFPYLFFYWSLGFTFRENNKLLKFAIFPKCENASSFSNSKINSVCYSFSQYYLDDIWVVNGEFQELIFIGKTKGDFK